jgi:hypothetical protein
LVLSVVEVKVLKTRGESASAGSGAYPNARDAQIDQRHNDSDVLRLDAVEFFGTLFE